MIGFSWGKIDENDERNVLNWYCSKIGMEATSFRRGALRDGRSFLMGSKYLRVSRLGGTG